MPAVRAFLLCLIALVATPSAAQAADIFAIGSQSRLTRVGPDGNTSVQARNPSVAHNSLNDEYLVAWVGNTTVSGDVEILGQILDGRGVAKGSVARLSEVPGAESPTSPVVSYSPKVNQYVLGYIATPKVISQNPVPPNSPDGQRELIAQVVNAAGISTGPPVRISDTGSLDADADVASQPAVAYDPEADRFRFAWVASSANDPNDDNVEIRTQAVSSALASGSGIELTVSLTPDEDAAPDEPAISYLPANDRFMIAWEAPNAADRPSIFVRGVSSSLGLGAFSQVEASTVVTASGQAVKPSIATNPVTNEALVAFVKDDSTTDDGEVFVQRVAADGGLRPNGTDQRISAMGVGNAAFGASTADVTTASYHPDLDRYFVTWSGEDDLPGLIDGEIERYGQALTGDGAEVATDDLRLTFTGPDSNTSVAPEDAATVPVTGKRAWLNVWDADDNRPPLANGEYEIYGRFVGDDGDLDGHVAPADCNDGNAGIFPGAAEALDNGVDEDCSGADAENPDRDADGSPRPADCNDANGGIRPGAADAADNGVDEDCNGADAVNFDRDGDGAARPGDCNDANAAIRPGAKDTPRNSVDEDCSGRDASFPNLTSGILPTWDIKGTRLRLVNLQITQQFPKGLKVKITCKGSRCPFKSKALKVGKVRRNAASVISSLTGKQRKFRAGQTLEVWVSAPDFNSRISRLVLKARKIPVSQPFCALPGSTKAQKTCA
ncbi:hypothetical protein DVA67_031330 [Solirubrobacter sp. CPCC 204708]|uniref:MopE-related protein n=1 Tax=Solirubrobacter deserti TaxID=2282478 RepID=A0ABT4RQN7_9ACTN|nr:putative metal-binding motif-containing protein [Solirubrobacter deserti]MBE2320497.1 hypothetical protein [Solirubrobacter deserti]MDA0140743.1 MopE-related protein [Solirubrobacter deserti]